MQEAKQTMALVNKRNIFLETILTVKKKKKASICFYNGYKRRLCVFFPQEEKMTNSLSSETLLT